MVKREKAFASLRWYCKSKSRCSNPSKSSVQFQKWRHQKRKNLPISTHELRYSATNNNKNKMRPPSGTETKLFFHVGIMVLQVTTTKVF